MRTRTSFLDLGALSWALSAALHLAAFALLWFVGRPRFLDLTQVDWALLGGSRRAGGSAVEVELEDEVWRRPGARNAHPSARTVPKLPAPNANAAPDPNAGAGSGADEGYRTVAQVSRPPRPLEALDAAFPEEARKAGVEGVVILQVDIDEAGLVKQVAVVQALGYGCDEAAETAVRNARFAPALAGDTPVPVRVRIPFRFQYQ